MIQVSMWPWGVLLPERTVLGAMNGLHDRGWRQHPGPLRAGEWTHGKYRGQLRTILGRIFLEISIGG